MTRYVAYLLLFLSLVLFTFSGFGQTSTLQGRVVDTLSGGGVAYATVQVSLDDSIRGGAMADSLGYFLCSKIPRGKLLVRVDAMGYESRQVEVLLEGAKLDMGSIMMVAGSLAIEEVRVRGGSPEVVLRPNRKEITLPASDVAAGVPLDELLLRVPGFVLGNRGELEMVNGSFSILINGRPSGLNASQLNTIDPSTIERIEVITAPSVQYRAGTAGGILNIITKSFRPGFNAAIQALGSFLGYLRGNFSGNVAWEKVNIFASLYGLYDFEPRSYLSRTTSAEGQLIEEHSTKNSRKWADIFPKIGVEWMPRKEILLGTYYSYDYVWNRDSGALLINRPIKGIELNGTRKWDVRKPTHNLHLYYSHSFEEIGGELSFDASGSYQNGRAEQSMEGTVISPWIRMVDPINLLYVASSTLDYSMGLPWNLSLSTGLAGDYHMANYRQKVFNRKNNTSEWGNERERATWSEGGVVGAYADLGYQPIEQLSLNAGLRYEHFLRTIITDYGTDPRISQNEGHLFASAGISYKPNSWLATSLSYASRVSRPSTESYVASEAVHEMSHMVMRGNPNLLFAYLDMVELNISQNLGDYYFSQDVSFTYTKNPIMYGSRLEQDSIWWQSIENDKMSRFWQAGFYFYGRPTSWFSYNLYSSFYLQTMQDLEGYVYGRNFFQTLVTGSINFYFLKYFTLSTRIYYSTPVRQRTRKNFHRAYWDAYLYYRPINDLSISLSIQNILDHAIQEYDTYAGDNTTHWRINWFPRTVYLNVYWRIGKRFRSKMGENLNNYESAKQHQAW